MRPHRPKRKEICSTSHTVIERPTSGSGIGHKSYIISNVRTMKWSRADQRRPMDLALEDHTTQVTSQMMEIRPEKILEGHDLEEDSTRHGNLATACWGLRPATGHYGCPMMIEKHVWALHTSVQPQWMITAKLFLVLADCLKLVWRYRKTIYCRGRQYNDVYRTGWEVGLDGRSLQERQFFNNILLVTHIYRKMATETGKQNDH